MSHRASTYVEKKKKGEMSFEEQRSPPNKKGLNIGTIKFAHKQVHPHTRETWVHIPVIGH
jgi:hypothetical protein